MSGKDSHHDTFGPGFWLAAGFGTAMLAGHVMLRAMKAMHEAGAPARMMLRGPFGSAGVMFGATGAAEPEAPRARKKRAASEAEVVAPVMPPIPSPNEAAVAVAKATEPFVAAAKETLDAASETIVALTPRAPAAEPAEAPEAEPEPALEIATEAPAALAEAPEAATPPAEAAEAAAPEGEAEAEAETEAASEPGAAPLDPARPTALAEPRSAADDLKRIKGVGPKLEATLNGLGYYHFDQIAAWGPEELARVEETLGGTFAGRAERDDWIGQARALAGGETN